MKRKFVLPTKALSINKVHCRDQRYLTSAAHDYIRTVLHLISNEKTSKKLAELRDYFDPTKHIYKLEITYFYPYEIFFTKKGTVNAKSHDLSNVEKPLIDILYLPKHFGDSPPNKAKNLNIDDKYIVDLHSRKRPAEDYLIEVEIEIDDISKLYPEHHNFSS